MNQQSAGSVCGGAFNRTRQLIRADRLDGVIQHQFVNDRLRAVGMEIEGESNSNP